jgi:N-formylglutamate amidohydrolase
MAVYECVAGTGPVVVSMPHVGALIPQEIADRMTEAGRGAPDTDWHVNRLYDFLAELGLPHIRSIYARYVADLNRSPEGTALYANARETEFVPLTTFDDQPIYEAGREPDDPEVASRRREYWQPYHLALAQLLAEAKDRYGIAVLFDAHSIRSRVPRFFEGTLPDLNLGTRDGSSCADDLRTRLSAALTAAERDGYSHVADGRFKGGFITRSYGRPDENTHAVQLELSQATYMEEQPPWRFDDAKAARIRPHLRRLVETCRDWALETAPRRPDG